MLRRLTPAASVMVASLMGSLVWGLLTFQTTLLAPLDALSLTPGVPLASPLGQFLAFVSFVTYPGVFYAALAVLAIWVWRRRLRRLAYALVAAPLASMVTGQALKMAINRPRPALEANLITSDPWSYPSGHMIGITTFVVLIAAITVIIRPPSARRRIISLVLVASWALVAYDRRALRAHYATDIIAGTLWGVAVASTCLVVFGVHSTGRQPRPTA